VFDVQIIIVKGPSLVAADYKDVKYTVGSHGSHIQLIDCPLTTSFP
jgi:hypothetical protein